MFGNSHYMRKIIPNFGLKNISNIFNWWSISKVVLISEFLHMEEELLKCWNLKHDTVQGFELEGEFQQLDSQLLPSLERERWGFVSFLLRIKQMYMKCPVKSKIWHFLNHWSNRKLFVYLGGNLQSSKSL